MTDFNDPEHWRKRAAEARALAETFTDKQARERMLEVAAGYERLARLAEERARAKDPKAK
jgi:hypothetical protein